MIPFSTTVQVPYQSKKYIKFYNSVRPHRSLSNKTPNEFHNKDLIKAKENRRNDGFHSITTVFVKLYMINLLYVNQYY